VKEAKVAKRVASQAARRARGGAKTRGCKGSGAWCCDGGKGSWKCTKDCRKTPSSRIVANSVNGEGKGTSNQQWDRGAIYSRGELQIFSTVQFTLYLQMYTSLFLHPHSLHTIARPFILQCTTSLLSSNASRLASIPPIWHPYVITLPTMQFPPVIQVFAIPGSIPNLDPPKSKEMKKLEGEWKTSRSATSYTKMQEQFWSPLQATWSHAPLGQQGWRWWLWIM
jgi:hypothetical protein